MELFPAIDLYDGKAVRLFKGDYSKMTVYSNDPPGIGLDFLSCGAENIHIVDLEGAKDGQTPNFETVVKIKEKTGLFCEIGGGIRSMDAIDKYINAGIDRVILGTAAVSDENLVRTAVEKYGPAIAVGADLKGGYVAIKGWVEKSNVSAYDFFEKMQSFGVETIICTDISRDGAMQGTNRILYRDLSARFNVNITASGGVSTLDDIIALKEMNLYAAIIGKAYYTGDIDLKKAIGLSV